MPNMVTLTVGGPHLFVLMTFENVKTPHIHRRWETPRTTNLPEKKFFFQPKMKIDVQVQKKMESGRLEKLLLSHHHHHRLFQSHYTR